MADAFVAIADDATAASWNPAGLIQLELPEISLVGSFNALQERFDAKDILGFDSTHRDQNLDINFASIVYPVPRTLAGHNATVSLTYQRKYDFSRNFEVNYMRSVVNTRGIARNDQIQFGFEQEGGLSAITPAFAIEVTPRLSVGMSLNLWRSTPIADNSWSQEQKRSIFSVRGSALLTSTTHVREEYSDFEGENAVFGVLWSATDKLSLAARYDTAFTGKVDYKRQSIRFGSLTPVRSATEDRKMRLPGSLALGAAYRFGDKFWMALDVTRTDWDDFWIENEAGQKRSLIDASNLGLLIDRSDFQPTITARLGWEYLFLPEELEENLDRLWIIRGGVFYDQEPANGHPDNFYGAAFGVGLLVNQNVNLDFAYQIRYGDDVNADFFRGIPGFQEDVIQHRALLSTVIYFGSGGSK
jgi:long-subunit fatty acid transport protein